MPAPDTSQGGQIDFIDGELADMNAELSGAAVRIVGADPGGSGPADSDDRAEAERPHALRRSRRASRRTSPPSDSAEMGGPEYVTQPSVPSFPDEVTAGPTDELVERAFEHGGSAEAVVPARFDLVALAAEERSHHARQELDPSVDPDVDLEGSEIEVLDSHPAASSPAEEAPPPRPRVPTAPVLLPPPPAEPPAAPPLTQAAPAPAPGIPRSERTTMPIAVVADGSGATAPPLPAGPPVPAPSTAAYPPVPPPLMVPALPAVEAPAAPRRRRRGKQWFEEIFDDDYLRTLPTMTARQTEREANFILESLGLGKGALVLDVACGYGRHAMEVAARGLQVTGLDLSLPLLIRAADAARRAGVGVNFVHGDMRDMAFDNDFDGAYCMLTSFGYFDDDSNRKVAANLSRAIRPGGKLLIDVINRDYLLRELPARVWWQGDGCVVLEEADFNYYASRLEVQRSIVFEDGRQLEQDISIRAYSLHELGKLLHYAGFRVTEVSGGLSPRGKFLGADSRQLMVLAERKAP